MRADRLRRSWLALAALLAIVCASQRAQAQVFAEELRVKGFWPDLALTLGAGFGFGDAPESPLLGRFRAGALYAYEPIIINLGISGELGGLGGRGLGAELELNDFGGLWLRGGVERVLHDTYMTHVTLGYTLFGIEWQHRFDGVPDNALMFVVRAPIGIWWFLLVDDARRMERQRERQREQQRRTGTPAPAPTKN